MLVRLVPLSGGPVNTRLWNPQDLSGMSDTKNPGDKTLHVAPKTLSLKRPVEQGTVRQSFSHGRSKSVVVETVKRRPVVPGAAPRDEKPVPQQAAAPVPAKPAASAKPAGSPAGQG